MADNVMTRCRAKITQALTAAGITVIEYNPFEMPETLPCAIVSLKSDKGADPASDGYLSQDFYFTVRLVVAATDNADPDKDIYALKELFRSEYRALAWKDIDAGEYYPSRKDAEDVVVCELKIPVNGDAEYYEPQAAEQPEQRGYHHGWLEFEAAGAEKDLEAGDFLTALGLDPLLTVEYLSVNQVLLVVIGGAGKRYDMNHLKQIDYADALNSAVMRASLNGLTDKAKYHVTFTVKVN